MNLKRTLSAAVLAFALTMMPAFVACSPDDNKTDIETPDKPENPDPEPGVRGKTPYLISVLSGHVRNDEE